MARFIEFGTQAALGARMRAALAWRRFQVERGRGLHRLSVQDLCDIGLDRAIAARLSERGA